VKAVQKFNLLLAINKHFDFPEKSHVLIIIIYTWLNFEYKKLMEDQEMIPSLRLNHGSPVLIVSERLGISKPSITLDVKSANPKQIGGSCSIDG
jgi:hypothetical protein